MTWCEGTQNEVSEGISIEIKSDQAIQRRRGTGI